MKQVRFPQANCQLDNFAMKKKELGTTHEEIQPKLEALVEIVHLHAHLTLPRIVLSLEG